MPSTDAPRAPTRGAGAHLLIVTAWLHGATASSRGCEQGMGRDLPKSNWKGEKKIGFIGDSNQEKCLHECLGRTEVYAEISKLAACCHKTIYSSSVSFFNIGYKYFKNLHAAAPHSPSAYLPTVTGFNRAQ